jgi:ADP-ribosyl-[dinitrogen reductase] hydrolase
MTSSPLLYPVRAALLGLAVGDAIGVPVEFTSREERVATPVTGMHAYGTHHQPAGTWSDDASLTFCLAESLAAFPDLNDRDLANRFCQWLATAYWTAHGHVFDIGIATRHALDRLQLGIPPAQAGGTGEYDNGNGALMRILPLVFHAAFQQTPTDFDAQLTLTHAAARITHGHPRSTVACWLYLTVAKHLLSGASPAAACAAMNREANTFLPTADAAFAMELPPYATVLSGSLAALQVQFVRSSGYVVHTLEAALWCLLTESTYAATVLKAANLGEDTDTTAAVAGGLAGLAYGTAAIPTEWLDTLARHADIEALAGRLAVAL